MKLENLVFKKSSPLADQDRITLILLLLVRACMESQFSSWLHSSTCAFAYLREITFRCNFCISRIGSLI